jgi:hypothetical protein
MTEWYGATAKPSEDGPVVESTLESMYGSRGDGSEDSEVEDSEAEDSEADDSEVEGSEVDGSEAEDSEKETEIETEEAEAEEAMEAEVKAEVSKSSADEESPVVPKMPAVIFETNEEHEKTPGALKGMIDEQHMTCISTAIKMSMRDLQGKAAPPCPTTKVVSIRDMNESKTKDALSTAPKAPIPAAPPNPPTPTPLNAAQRMESMRNFRQMSQKLSKHMHSFVSMASSQRLPMLFPGMKVVLHAIYHYTSMVYTCAL